VCVCVGGAGCQADTDEADHAEGLVAGVADIVAGDVDRLAVNLVRPALCSTGQGENAPYRAQEEGGGKSECESERDRMVRAQW
jgi:hypothetical protein